MKRQVYLMFLNNIFLHEVPSDAFGRLTIKVEQLRESGVYRYVFNRLPSYQFSIGDIPVYEFVTVISPREGQ